ncbi:hypothetical protein [Gordonia alkaliphila]|uniref:Major tail protein n=1 Tax=Gordonia alkaliphila TaxID=1053547 RepID=A0ABP8ZJV2_9ACTN
MAQKTFAAMPRVTGALRRAPLGTERPTDASAALDAAYVDLGFIGEDGFTEATTRDSDPKRALGGSIVRVLQTEFGTTVSFIFLESLNLEVLKAVYGDDNVIVDGATGNVTVKRNKKPLPESQWVIDLEDGDALDRSDIGRGQITEIGDVQRVHSDLVAYEVTITCYEDENGDTLVGHLFADHFKTPVGP